MVNRIILLLKTQDLTSSQFADEIGVQRSSISHILSGRNNASLEFVTKILKRFPDLNSDWLIFGKGAMYRESNAALADKLALTDELREPDLFSMPIVEELPKAIPEAFSEVKGEIIREVIVETPAISQIPELKTVQIDTKADIIEPQEVKKEDFVEKTPDIKAETKPEKSSEKAIEKIVIFYNDRTFREYFPE